MRIILSILFLFIPTWVIAGPSISSTSGTWAHGTSITINGLSFGSKSPAAPLIWDDCENKNVDSDSAVSDVWDEVHPNISTAAHKASRTRYRNIPYRNTPAPHSNSSKYLAGCHYQYANNDPQYIGERSDDQEYRDVLVTVDNGSPTPFWYVSFYYTLDPLWNTSETNYNNHKVTVVNSGATAWSTPMQYNAYCSTDGPAKESGNNCQIEGHSSNNEFGGCNVAPLTNNPRLDWVKVEETISPEDDKRHMYIDKTHAFQDDTVANPRSFTIAGYYRRVRDGGSISNTADYRGGVLDSNYRYFDDMYVDTTVARAMLCNHATYASATICEPQIPSAWSNSSIAATVNLGALTGSAVYLFVFDANNNHNSSGYPVSIGGGGAPDTPDIPESVEIISK